MDAGQAPKAARLLSQAVALLRAAAGLPRGDQSGNRRDTVVTGKRQVRVSLRAVAEAVGVSHAYLSQARKGLRRIKRSTARQIAAITPDLPATEETWPKGWAKE